MLLWIYLLSLFRHYVHFQHRRSRLRGSLFVVHCNQACFTFLLVVHVHQLSFLHNGVQLVANFLLNVFLVLFSSSETYTFSQAVTMASFFFLVIIAH